MGTLIFIVFINDIVNVSIDIRITMFADDTIVSCSHENPVDLYRIMKRGLSHIIHCRKSWKAAGTVFAGQAMQTSTLHTPTAVARMRNTNISAHSKGNGNR